MRVLVVGEDAAERSRVVSAMGLLEGAEAFEVDNVADVRRRVLVDGEHFDVIVVDGDLDPRGGYAALYDLRQRFELDGRTPIPSLVLASRPQDAWLTRWAGANGMLLKPVDTFELIARLAEVADEPAPAYGDEAATRAQVRAAAGLEP